MKWLDQVRENLAMRKEQQLLEKNRQQHSQQSATPDTHKVVESFVAPPPFLLYLWATTPLLLISTYQDNAIITGVVSTIFNFFLIHLDTFQFVRFLLSSGVLIVALLLYHFNII